MAVLFDLLAGGSTTAPPAALEEATT